MTSIQNYNDDNNNDDDSNSSRSTRALSIQKRKGTVSFFFHHRILVEAAHVRKIVNLGLLQKDTVVSVHKDSGERIVTKAYSSSNANIPAFFMLLGILVFLLKKISESCV